MEELEDQILSKILALEKERSSITNINDHQQQEVDKELDALQNRVADLEHGQFWQRREQESEGPKVCSSSFHIFLFLGALPGGRMSAMLNWSI